MFCECSTSLDASFDAGNFILFSALCAGPRFCSVTRKVRWKKEHTTHLRLFFQVLTIQLFFRHNFQVLWTESTILHDLKTFKLPLLRGFHHHFKIYFLQLQVCNRRGQTCQSGGKFEGASSLSSDMVYMSEESVCSSYPRRMDRRCYAGFDLDSWRQTKTEGRRSFLYEIDRWPRKSENPVVTA